MKQSFVVVVTRVLIFIFFLDFISRQLGLDIETGSYGQTSTSFYFCPICFRNISRVKCMFVYVWERKTGNS